MKGGAGRVCRTVYVWVDLLRGSACDRWTYISVRACASVERAKHVFVARPLASVVGRKSGEARPAPLRQKAVRLAWAAVPKPGHKTASASGL